MLINQGANITVGSMSINMGPLHMAAHLDRPEIAKLLLQAGANVDALGSAKIGVTEGGLSPQARGRRPRSLPRRLPIPGAPAPAPPGAPLARAAAPHACPAARRPPTPLPARQAGRAHARARGEIDGRSAPAQDGARPERRPHHRRCAPPPCPPRPSRHPRRPSRVASVGPRPG